WILVPFPRKRRPRDPTERLAIGPVGAHLVVLGLVVLLDDGARFDVFEANAHLARRPRNGEVLLADLGVDVPLALERGGGWMHVVDHRKLTHGRPVFSGESHLIGAQAKTGLEFESKAVLTANERTDRLGFGVAGRARTCAKLRHE